MFAVKGSWSKVWGQAGLSVLSKMVKTRACLFADGWEPSGREKLKMGNRKELEEGDSPKREKGSEPQIWLNNLGSSQNLC
jgi:hypothetical protein